MGGGDTRRGQGPVSKVPDVGERAGESGAVLSGDVGLEHHPQLSRQLVVVQLNQRRDGHPSEHICEGQRSRYDPGSQQDSPSICNPTVAVLQEKALEAFRESVKLPGLRYWCWMEASEEELTCPSPKLQ